jgi:glycosyltransferase involved in cell wall biosynthesis
MSRDRLELLYVSIFPPSPPRYGAQRRIQGILQALSRNHNITALSLISPDLEPGKAERAMREYCREVVLIPSRPWEGLGKRYLQARSLFSTRSYERSFYSLPDLRRALDRLLSRRRYQFVNLEFPFLAHLELAQAPVGDALPLLVLDEHNIEFDLLRQMAGTEHGLARRLYNSMNWPKVRREELSAWRRFDGVTFTSATDEARARTLMPSLRSAVIPNSVDVDYFRPRAADPPSDGCTVMFFGAINYFPNIDGVLFFAREVWPLLAASHPRARLKIVGQHPTREILALHGPRVEVAGVVDDLRPHLARAAVVIVPLRIGGGTRFKILEAMAMAKPIVSTAIGAEGIDVVPGRNILLADTPVDFAAAVGRILDDAGMAAPMGREGRGLVEERYSWEAAATQLEGFFAELLSAGRRSGS